MWTLHWRHNDRGGVSDHQPHDCLLSTLFRLRSKKTSKLRGTGLCAGNSPGPVNSPRKGPVTRKMFPFDDVIMKMSILSDSTNGYVLESILVGSKHIQVWFCVCDTKLRACDALLEREFFYNAYPVETAGVVMKFPSSLHVKAKHRRHIA